MQRVINSEYYTVRIVPSIMLKALQRLLYKKYCSEHHTVSIAGSSRMKAFEGALYRKHYNEHDTVSTAVRIIQ